VRKCCTGSTYGELMTGFSMVWPTGLPQTVAFGGWVQPNPWDAGRLAGFFPASGLLSQAQGALTMRAS
jgi:hypothetical protein